MRRLTSFVCFLTVALLGVTTSALAQFQGPPEISIVTPENGSTRHALNPKIRVEWSIGGQCIDDGSGGCDPDTGTLVIKVNGVNKNRSFTIDGGGQYAQNGTGNAGNVNLTNGQWNSIYAKICNAYDCAEETISVYIQAGPQQQLEISPLHPSVYRPDACEAVGVAPGAAFACDAVVFTHAIPGYVSLGVLRSVALVYSSRSALARVTVPANVQLVWDAAATKVQAWLQGAADSTYWDGLAWDGASGSVKRRIVLSKAESTQTGGYIGRQLVTFTIRVHTAAGTYDSSKVDTLPFYFERDSLTTPIARGWSISGLSRIYGIAGHNSHTSAPTGDVLVVENGGSVAYFKFLSNQGLVRTYARPDGVYATLTYHSTYSPYWELLGIDGTRQYYSWVYNLGYARLDSSVTAAGTTRIHYRHPYSGSPDSIIDPVGQKIRFAYVGHGLASLTSICAPAGANERCVNINYTSGGPGPVVSSITDPDGVSTTFGYLGAPQWSLITSYRPRAWGTYKISYNTNLKRPMGVLQPSLTNPSYSSADTLTYVAPQLAGAALVGGSSGSPATPANADSAWGSVRRPLGPTTYFTADRFGLVLLRRRPDNTLTRITRNSSGQPLSARYSADSLFAWSYNSIGALTVVQRVGGSPTTTTYSGACASGAGYPCLPAQRVQEHGSLPADTTKWYYANELLDSVYHSSGPSLNNAGTTRMWHGLNSRLDSLVDPQGHRQRFQYEGTWGNQSVAISDSIMGKCPPPTCAQLIDTTILVYDSTGRVGSRRHGGTGRSVTVFRDRVGRDTMSIDTASGGGSAITTKIRFDDSNHTVTVIDGNGHSIVSEFDLRGRLVTVTDPIGWSDYFTYDRNDRDSTWTTRRGQTVTYTYDAAGRLRTKSVPNEGTWTYGYNATYGTLDTLLTPSASLYRMHNSKGWLTQEKTVVNGVTRILSYTYDANGVLDSLTDPWGGVYTFGWDVPNRARTIRNPLLENFSLRHSSEGMLSQVVFPTGTDSFGYDASHLVKSAGLNAELTYTRDTVTKGLASIKLGGMTQTFGYDGFGRLASEAHDSATAVYGPGSESHNYDAAGNRIGNGYSYDSTNAVRGRPNIPGDTFAPGDSLVFDVGGNPVWWKNKSSQWYDSLTWNAEGRLIRLRRYNQSNNLQLDVQYAYDGLGRRVKKWVTGGTTTLYVWDGGELLAETDGSGNALRQYTHAPEETDFPLAMRANGTTSFFHLDGQGNVYLLTDSAGTRQSEYRYRAYGDRYVTPTGETVQSPLTYKGREEDRETGLVYMRNRYYSPRLERFVNSDPIGLGGGLNVYTFARLSPVNGRDATGLCPDQMYDSTKTYGGEECIRWDLEQVEEALDILASIFGITVGELYDELGAYVGGRSARDLACPSSRTGCSSYSTFGSWIRVFTGQSVQSMAVTIFHEAFGHDHGRLGEGLATERTYAIFALMSPNDVNTVMTDIHGEALIKYAAHPNPRAWGRQVLFMMLPWSWMW